MRPGANFKKMVRWQYLELLIQQLIQCEIVVLARIHCDYSADAREGVPENAGFDDLGPSAVAECEQSGSSHG